MNGLDRLSDMAAIGGADIAQEMRNIVVGKALDRYDAFVAAKMGYYYGTHQLFSPDQEDLSLSGNFGPNAFYDDKQHKGIDISGPLGASIFTLFGGRVVRNDGTSKTAGNTVEIELGFMFENAFYDTGIREQFMHLTSSSPLAINAIVDGQTFLGNMGNTGLTDPSGAGGTHLHYQLMGDRAAYSPYSAKWDMYQQRRDMFLNFFRMPSTNNWSNNKPTSDANFWAANRTYLNYYYNTSGLLRSPYAQILRQT
jgi:murein DD-endopeptidase MepM/ murein hydrolase activator NlpD